MLPLFAYYVPFVPVRVHVDAPTCTPPLPVTVVHLRTQFVAIVEARFLLRS
jgi:hypothetical protein